jgi:hypothetical protein
MRMGLEAASEWCGIIPAAPITRSVTNLMALHMYDMVVLFLRVV